MFEIFFQSQSEEFQKRNPVLDINEMLKNSSVADDKPTASVGANCLLAMACNELTKTFAYLNIKCNGLSEIDQKLLLLFRKDKNYEQSYKHLQTTKGRPGSLTPQEI